MFSQQKSACKSAAAVSCKSYFLVLGLWTDPTHAVHPSHHLDWWLFTTDFNSWHSWHWHSWHARSPKYPSAFHSSLVAIEQPLISHVHPMATVRVRKALIYDASAMTVGNLTVGMASSACWEFPGGKTGIKINGNLWGSLKFRPEK